MRSSVTRDYPSGEKEKKKKHCLLYDCSVVFFVRILLCLLTIHAIIFVLSLFFTGEILVFLPEIQLY